MVLKNEIKKIQFTFFISLLFFQFVSASNYGQGSYGDGFYGIGEIEEVEFCGDNNCNNGETCLTCPQDCGICSSPSGGGGSKEVSKPKCYYDWQCTDWFPQICPESKTQSRICINRGTCTGTEQMPDQIQSCEYTATEPLFDIYLTLNDEYKKICAGEKIKINIKLENYAKVELLDAFMTYWVVDENNKLIAEIKDTRAVEKGTNFNVELQIPDSVNNGTYRVYAEITYNGNKTAIAGSSFEVLSKNICKTPSLKISWKYFFYLLIGVIALGGIYFIIKILKKKFVKTMDYPKYKRKTKKYLKKLLPKYFLIPFLALILIFSFSSVKKVTGFVINKSFSPLNQPFICICLIIMIGFVILTCRKKFVGRAAKNEKINLNCLGNLISKKIYSEDGTYLGKVKEIIIEENKIKSLKITLKKGYKFKGIFLDYGNIKSAGEIIITDNKILNEINQK